LGSCPGSTLFATPSCSPFWPWRLDNIYEKTYRWADDKLGMVKLELKPSEYILRNFTLTTSGMSRPDVFDYTLGKVGAQRLMFAVDCPYEHTRVATDFLTALDLTDEQCTLVSHANAERLFRIPPADEQPDRPEQGASR
jgi:5-carboxyvanillate decarboxylase